MHYYLHHKYYDKPFTIHIRLLYHIVPLYTSVVLRTVLPLLPPVASDYYLHHMYYDESFTIHLSTISPYSTIIYLSSIKIVLPLYPPVASALLLIPHVL